MKRISRLRRVGVVVFVLSSLLSLSALVGTQAHGTAGTAITTGASGYKYQVVAWGAGAGFEAVGFDDSGWADGQAGFGTTNGPCGWNNTTSVKTIWPLDTDILVRKTFDLPAGAHNVRVLGTIDNDATVYVNGQLIGSKKDGFCNANGIDFIADSAAVTGENVLAIRGTDLGVASFLDVQVTYDVPYSICPLYDQAKAHKSGSTVPIKLQLCDADGNNLSSSSIVVHATSLIRSDATVAPGDVEDSGNANPDDDFRYDADLDGYIFNLSTKGLSSGTWVLSFTVDGEVDSSYSVSFDVK